MQHVGFFAVSFVAASRCILLICCIRCSLMLPVSWNKHRLDMRFTENNLWFVTVFSLEAQSRNVPRRSGGGIATLSRPPWSWRRWRRCFPSASICALLLTRSSSTSPRSDTPWYFDVLKACWIFGVQGNQKTAFSSKCFRFIVSTRVFCQKILNLW